MKAFCLLLLLLVVAVRSDLVCNEGEFVITVQKIFVGDSKNEEYQIWDGEDPSSTMLFKRVNTRADSMKTVRDYVCLKEGDYSLRMFSRDGNGWGYNTQDNTRLSILYGDVELHQDRMPFKYGGENYAMNSTFTIQLDLPIGYQIRYTDEPQSNLDWTKGDFDDSEWGVGYNDKFPDFTATTRYYRIAVHQPEDYNKMTTFDNRLFTDNGFVLYNNEHELYRHKLPETVTATTSATEPADEEIVEKSATVYKGYIPSNSVFVVAIEVHRYVPSDKEAEEPEKDRFSFLGQYLYNEPEQCANNRFYEGEFSCVQPPNQPLNDCAHIYDNCVGTFFESNNTKELITTYAFKNGRREWINNYVISTSEIYSFPTAWHLYGSNDNKTWVHLDYQKDYPPVEKWTNYTINIRSNRQSFNMYKLHILDSTSTNVAISMFRVYTCNYEPIPDTLYYPVTEYTDAYYHNEVRLAPISSNYYNFAITPDLPTNVTMDSFTGRITGIPKQILSHTYVISATNIETQEVSSFSIDINIVDCLPPELTLLRVIKSNMYDAGYEHFELFNSHNELVLDHPLFKSQQSYQRIICLPPDHYRIHMFTYDKIGYDRAADFILNQYYNAETENTLCEVNIDTTRDGNHYVNTRWDLNPREAGWKYLEGYLPSDDWYMASYSDDSWSDYLFSEPMHSTADLWLFRKHFNIRTLEPYTSFELRFTCHGGYAVYINDVEFYRQHIPEGPISNSTLPDYGRGDIVEWYGLTGELSYLHDGPNFISFAIYNKDDARPDVMDFDATLQMILPSNFTRDYLVLFNSTPSGVYPYYLFNKKVSYPFTNNYNDNEVLKMFMSLDFVRAEFINQYCFTSSYSSSSYDLFSWSIWGVDVYGRYTRLDYVPGTRFFGRVSERCFPIANNHKTYKNFYFEFYRPRVTGFYQNKYVVGEMSLLARNFNGIPVPPLRFDSPFLVTQVNITFPHNPVNSNYYNFFTISPPLPEPLFIDTTNGDILGIPRASFMRQDYVVTAMDLEGNPSSTTISLMVTECSHNSVYLNVKIEGGRYASTEGFQIKPFDSKDVVIEETNIATYSNETYTYCLPYDNYEFIPLSTSKLGWEHSRYFVYLDNYYLLLTGSLEETLPNKHFNISTHMVVPPRFFTWKYMDGHQELTPDWITPEFDDSKWTPVETQKIQSFNTITQYYRGTVDIDVNTYPAIEIVVRTHLGLVFYLNSKELFRKNMPDDAVGVDTFCLNYYEDEQVYRHSYYLKDTNKPMVTLTVAFEIHEDIDRHGVNNFDIYIRYLSESTYMSLLGKPDSDVYNDIQIDNIFDNDRTTVYRTGPRCVGTQYYYTFPHQNLQIVNAYTLTSSYTCNTQLPSSWVIEGSLDGEQYVLLSTVNNQFFTKLNETIRYVFYNEKSYNSYRITVTECNNTHLVSGERDQDCYYRRFEEQGSLIADIGLFVRQVNASCAPEDGYNGALEGDYAYKQCPPYYDGIYQRKCLNGVMQEEEDLCVELPVSLVDYDPDAYVVNFEEYFSITPVIRGAHAVCSVSPSLPEDIVFNATTGTISGRSRSLFGVTTYTVTCGNTKGNATTLLYLSCVEKSQTPVWISLVSMFTIILVVVVFIFFIWVTKKNEKKNQHTPLIESD